MNIAQQYREYAQLADEMLLYEKDVQSDIGGNAAVIRLLEGLIYYYNHQAAFWAEQVAMAEAQGLMSKEDGLL